VSHINEQFVKQQEQSLPIAYFDNAATSFPKPPGVIQAIRSCLDQSLTVARSTHHARFRGDDVLRRCRARLADFFNAVQAEEIIYTYSATDGLNLAINGLLAEGGHAIVSPLEHHSVMRPLHHLRRSGRADFNVLPADPEGYVDAGDIAGLLRPDTACIIINWISNVSGVEQPVQQIGNIARELGIPYLIDASQAAGTHVIDVQALQCSAMALPGHKAMMSIPGTGLLYLQRDCDLPPWRIGGTGHRSDQLFQPQERPLRYESGTPNVAGIVGLDAALDWFAETGMDRIAQRCRFLTDMLLTGLQEIREIKLLGPALGAARGYLVSFSAGETDPLVFSDVLSSRFGISSRAGLHCAPGAHEHYGTLAAGGSIRLSVGYFTTEQEIELCLAAIRETVAGF
jgi:cysteine desulfurase family protein